MDYGLIDYYLLYHSGNVLEGYILIHFNGFALWVRESRAHR